jgi:hypothetical protein
MRLIEKNRLKGKKVVEIIKLVFGKPEEGKKLDEKKVWGFCLCSKYVNM